MKSKQNLCGGITVEVIFDCRNENIFSLIDMDKIVFLIKYFAIL